MGWELAWERSNPTYNSRITNLVSASTHTETTSPNRPKIGHPTPKKEGKIKKNTYKIEEK